MDLSHLTNRCYINLNKALNLTMIDAQVGTSRNGKTVTTKIISWDVLLYIFWIN